jgi:peptidyl-prolyl cis-trans isomerase-like protein 2
MALIVSPSVQDPFEIYEERLKAKLARQDQSEDALAQRAAKKAKREQDRTTWLGTNLEDKDAKRKRGNEEEASVGKYLAAKKTAAVGSETSVAGVGSSGLTGGYSIGGQEKKQKKAGGFGDFSGW